MSQRSGSRTMRAAILLLVPVAALAMFGIEAASTALADRSPEARAAAIGRLANSDSRLVAPSASKSGVVQKADFEETGSSNTGVGPGRGR